MRIFDHLPNFFTTLPARCLAGYFLIIASMQAGSVTIQNPGFETDGLTLGGYSQLIVGSTLAGFSRGSLDGWVAAASSSSADAGAYAPQLGGSTWNTQWWTGNNVGYLQTGSTGTTVSISQALSATLQDGATYTLSALISRRLSMPLSYSIQLWAGSSMLGSASNLSLAAGDSGTDSLVYSSGASNPLAGQTLSIVIASTNLGAGSQTDAYFDNIALDVADASAPEPASFWLGGIGIAVWLGGRRLRI